LVDAFTKKVGALAKQSRAIGATAKCIFSALAFHNIYCLGTISFEKMAGEGAAIALLLAGKLQPQWLHKIAFGIKCFAGLRTMKKS